MNNMIYYVHINVTCILILLVSYLMVNNNRSIVSSKLKSFKALVILGIFMCASDIFAWYLNGMMFKGAKLMLAAANVIYFCSITLLDTEWLHYVLLVIGVESNAKSRLLREIPAYIVLLLILVTPYTGFMFTLDENNIYARGTGTLLHWVVSWGYLVWATVLIALEIRKAASKSQKDSLRPLFMFIVAPALAAVVQMVFYGVSALQSGVTVSIVLVAYRALQDQISGDMLTGLNNRRALDKYIGGQLQKGERNFSVLMCDVDRFKAINDTYGHAYGDEALKAVSGVLRRACGKTQAPLFLCRYGGDEFVACGVDLEEDAMLTLEENIRSELKELEIRHKDNVPLTLSLGSSNGMCAEYKDVERLIHIADVYMYVQKKAGN